MRRLERLARNQMLFRKVNDRIDVVRRASAHRGAYLCECSRDDCVEELDLTRDEYEELRARSTHFVVRPGHHVPEIERVVAQNDRFAVVEKVGRAGEIARDSAG